MDSPRLFKIAVPGSASYSEDSREGLLAFETGQAIATAGGILLTGGCTGLPHAAVRGARSVRGLTLAVSPAMNRDAHRTEHGYPLDSDVIVFTGMGTKGRNVILIRSADACVFIGGGAGTLNEFTIAFDELGSDCAIGVLDGTGGVSHLLRDLPSVVGKAPRALLIVQQDPEKLVTALFAHLHGMKRERLAKNS